MKIRTCFGLFFVVLLIVSMFGCGSITPAIKSVTVSEMLKSLDGRQLNTLKVIEFHPNKVIAELNGERISISKSGSESLIYWLNVGDGSNNGSISFGRQDFFDVEIWDIVRDRNPENMSMEYYVFRNDLETESMVLANKPDVRFVSADKWSGTETIVVFWEYPQISPMVVYNVQTRETAIMASAYAEDKSGNQYDLARGSTIWGNLTYLPDEAVGFGGIVVKQK